MRRCPAFLRGLAVQSAREAHARIRNSRGGTVLAILSKSLPSCLSCSRSSGGPKVWWTIRPHFTAGRLPATSTQRLTCRLQINGRRSRSSHPTSKFNGRTNIPNFASMANTRTRLRCSIQPRINHESSESLPLSSAVDQTQLPAMVWLSGGYRATGVGAPDIRVMHHQRRTSSRATQKRCAPEA
jgi:hypothetical protein